MFRAACAQLAELDLRPELHKVKVPVLVLVGEQDEATPPPMSHELAAGLPDARLKIIPGCAHVPQLQAPQVFLDFDLGLPADRDGWLVSACNPERPWIWRCPRYGWGFQCGI